MSHNASGRRPPHAWLYCVTVGAVVASGVLLEGAAPVVAQEQPKPKVVRKAPTAEAPPAADTPADAPAKGATQKKDPAAAARLIDNGVKLLHSGKAEQAIQVFSSAVSGGGLPPQQMARALYHRGAAYRKAGKPAQAISDLSSALWLQGGLNDADKADAQAQRSAAYKEAGLTDTTTADAAPKAAGNARPTRQAADASSAAGAWPTTATAAGATASLAPTGSPAQATPQVTNPVGNLFANLFGGGSSAASPQPAPPRAATPTATLTATAPAAVPATSAWTSSVTAQKAGSPATRTASLGPQAGAAAAPSPAPSKAAAVPTGGILARIALVKTEAEATAIAGRLRSQHAAALGTRQPDVSQAQFGGMGTFFQVRVGPYATTAEAQDFCKRVKGNGLDCVPVDR